MSQRGAADGEGERRKVIIVTGGARGIGRATGEVLARAGHVVVLADLDGFEVGAPDAFDCRIVDVRDPEAVDALVAGVLERHGSLDGLVNAAGFNRHASLEELKDEAWELLFDVHLGGVLRMCRAAAPYLKASRGAVVNFSSINSRLGRPRRAAYAAAKAGIEALTRTLAVEWARAGVRVNAVVPGIVNTRLVQSNIAQGLVDEASLIAGIPMGRMADAMEVATVVEFLLSPAASYVTGQAIVVDGGAIINGDW